jgi:Flp pilus assembly protein TadB
MVSAPDYAGILFKEPTGQLSLGLAGVFILLGHLAIKKIVTIKV